jgi:hypothetical protein
MSKGITPNSGDFPSTDHAHRDDSDIEMEITDTNFTRAGDPDIGIAITNRHL